MSHVPSRRRARLFPTAEECEAAFYDAFERGDIKAMMAVWAESDEVSCVHPSGARITATLLSELERRDARYGIASLCVGFGMAISGVVE